MRCRHRVFSLRRELRVALLWMLAVVVPLQCSAALARMAAGPMHSHPSVVAATTAPMVLRDFRRDIGTPSAMRPAAAPMLAAVFHGHSHPQRHHHRADAGAVVTAADSALDRVDAGDDGGASAGAFAELLPLVGTAPVWQPLASAPSWPASRSWAASSRVAATLERPPRGLQV